MSKMIKSIRSAAAKLAMLAIGVAGVSVQKSHAIAVVVGGNIQIVNLLNANPQLGLDFTSTSVGITVATFAISNNTTSFNLALAFTNGGRFENAGGTQWVALTSATLGPEGTGTLGTGATVLNPATAATATTITNEGNIMSQLPADGTPTTITWNPADQSTATSGYVVELLGGWTASTNLAGLYTETITATLTATL